MYFAKIYDKATGNTAGATITIPKLDTIQTITFTATMINPDGFMGIQFFNNTDGSRIWMDNVIITKIQ